MYRTSIRRFGSQPLPNNENNRKNSTARKHTQPESDVEERTNLYLFKYNVDHGHEHIVYIGIPDMSGVIQGLFTLKHVSERVRPLSAR